MNKLAYTIVKNRKQYDLYCDELKRLTNKGNSRDQDAIELLSLLIHKYNDEQSEQYQLNMSPVDLLVNLLEENKISQVELSRRIQISPQFTSIS